MLKTIDFSALYLWRLERRTEILVIPHPGIMQTQTVDQESERWVACCFSEAD
jgi:hypothetical protein